MADKSEGSVVLAACMAAVVAAGGLIAGRPAAKAEQAKTAAPAQVDAKAPARGEKGAVAAAAPEATEAGVAVLREGGNAVDALVAASFVVCVVRPHATGIGGGGFAVGHQGTEDYALDGRERAPAAATATMYLGRDGEPDKRAKREGARSAGVPGLVALLDELHRTRGSKNADGSSKIEWKRLLDPAIKLAEDGFDVPARLAAAIERNAELLQKNREAADVFLPGGVPLRAGSKLIQKDLARTLREIQRDRSAGFYQGNVAERIATSQRNSDGLITQKDLLEYSVRTRDVVRGQYRGYQIVSMPPPSSGGVHLVEMLNVLAGKDVKALGWQSPAHLHLLAETMRHAYADRSEHMGEPSDTVKVPQEWLLSAARADEIRRAIDASERATPSAKVRAGTAPREEGGNTTHVSVIDADGNACSATHTINTAFGSGVMVPGTGVLLNNEMDDFAAKAGESNSFGLVQGTKNLPAPGKRPLSSMTPTIVLDAKGKVVLVLGSPGGAHIITSVLQVLSNVIDFGLPLERAVGAPRVHHQWLPDQLEVEDGVDRATVDALVGRGHLVRIVGKPDEGVLGEVQAVQVGPTGERTAVTDPRGMGRPSAY